VYSLVFKEYSYSGEWLVQQDEGPAQLMLAPSSTNFDTSLAF
jgi:hypothetical protein